VTATVKAIDHRVVAEVAVAREIVLDDEIVTDLLHSGETLVKKSSWKEFH
jgi:hypothetical protein